MNPGSVLTAQIALGPARYAEPAQRQAFYDRVEERLRRLPGVELMAVSDTVPPAGMMRSMLFAAIEVDGRAPFAEGTGGMVAWRSVTPEYFAALRIPIVRGRGFTEEDRGAAEPVMILSDSLARRMFPNEDALGQRLRPGRSGPWRTVVGIAADVKNAGLDRAGDPEYYLIRRRTPEDATARTTLVLRSGMSVETMTQWVRREIGEVDATLPVTVERLDARVGRLAARPRFNAMLLGLFAATGLALAAIGLYGVVAFLVVQRTGEIGVRMALGATPDAIRDMVVGGAARWALAGSAVGLAGAWASAHAGRALLFEVAPNDAWALLTPALLLALVTVIAAGVPARRAARLDPAVTLRQD
jgi:predicted permease